MRFVSFAAEYWFGFYFSFTNGKAKAFSAA